MERKILKIEKDPLITSECWTYYKMAILQTCENFDEWLSGNLHLFLDQNGNALFGDNGSMYPISFYLDILEINDVDILTISSDDICKFIINQVANESYVLLDLNYEKLRDKFSEKLLIHETLIYGYDKNTGTFKTPILINDSFEEVDIGFDVVKDAFQDALDYYRDDSNRLYNRRAWFYGITIIKPKTDYFNSNAFYDLICKLKFQLNGDVFTKHRYIEAGILGNEYTYYTGISALYYFSQLIKQKIESSMSAGEAEKYRKTCLKIYENQKIVSRLLKWFLKKIKNETILMISNEYDTKCLKKTFECVMLFYKYSIDPMQHTLARISCKLEDVYKMEKSILEKIIPEIIKEYTEVLNAVP